MVFVSGSTSLRVYSSAKERCMKAGMTINVRQVELLGGKTDEIPNILFDATTGVQLSVKKFYNIQELVRDNTQPEYMPLVSRSQERYIADRNGWVQKYMDEA